MASIEVELPDGSIAEFPEDMPQDKISEAVQSHLGSKLPPLDTTTPFGGRGSGFVEPVPQTPVREQQTPVSTADVFFSDLARAPGKGLAGAVGGLLQGMAAAATPNVRKPYTGPTTLGIPTPVTPEDWASGGTDKAATMKAVQNDPFYQAGQSLRKTAANIEAPADSLLNNALESGGSMLPVVAAKPPFAPQRASDYRPTGETLPGRPISNRLKRPD